MLPSATEIVFALGLDDSLVGVTAECDHPPAARDKPAVSFPTVGTSPDAGRASTAQVDGAVATLVASGEPLYRIDDDLIRALRPDLILAQDLCRVCAVASGDVTDALDRLGSRAAVLSLDPATLPEVIDAVTAVAAVAGVAGRGRALAASLEARVDEVRRRTTGVRRRRVLELEWSDPPYLGGHWVPDMVEAAGGTVLLAAPGRPSPRVTWDEVAGADADVVVVAPCGYGLDEAVAEGAGLLERPGIATAGEVWALDGSAYFSRPGPRVVDGVELLAWVLHPGTVPAPPPGRARRLR
ncbi:MAG TPA: ABC transporter substrate-binding protein [Acidimicrobiales bacterium]|nr:ABC transporter substrate-binding protein [Acidimicrobiales bacterium]